MSASSNLDTPVAALKNLGPKSALRLNEIGIYTRGDLESTGAVMALKIMQHRFPGVNILYLYALHGALIDCHWNHLPPGDKEALQEAAAQTLEIRFGRGE
jgi:DNA transformation protein